MFKGEFFEINFLSYFPRIISQPHLWASNHEITNFQNENCPTDEIIEKALTSAYKIANSKNDWSLYDSRKKFIDKANQFCINWKNEFDKKFSQNCLITNDNGLFSNLESGFVFVCLAIFFFRPTKIYLQLLILIEWLITALNLFVLARLCTEFFAEQNVQSQGYSERLTDCLNRSRLFSFQIIIRIVNISISVLYSILTMRIFFEKKSNANTESNLYSSSYDSTSFP